MPINPDQLFRKLFNTPRKEFMRRETVADLMHEQEVKLMSNFPDKLIHLGHSKDEEIYLTQEDRESHMHILGAPGEGKSKLLELLIRADIKHGYGACLLDPSENGDTANKIIKYCASIGFEKVIYINPADFKTHKIPVLNPIKNNAPVEVSTGNLLDSIYVLWGANSFKSTPTLQRMATAMLDTLHAAGATLSDAQCLLTPDYPAQKDAILNAATRVHKTELRSGQLLSTLNRFTVFSDSVLKLMLGSTLEPINFIKLITDGWILLVNLDPQAVWGTQQIQQQALGTLLINEITDAIHRLREPKEGQNVWKGVYYLYVDETGDYATSKIAFLLDKKRKSGLRFTFGHQRFQQIDDPDVQSSIRGSAKTKVLFFTKNIEDRRKMMHDMGFGGDVPDRDAEYALGETEQQSAYININKKSPFKMRFVEVLDTEISPSALSAYKEKIYNHEWFHTKEEINNNINARFAREVDQPKGRASDQEGGNLESYGRRQVVDRRSAGGDSGPGQRESYFDKQVPEDSQVRTGVRRRSKNPPTDEKRRTSKKTPKKK